MGCLAAWVKIFLVCGYHFINWKFASKNLSQVYLFHTTLEKSKNRKKKYFLKFRFWTKLFLGRNFSRTKFLVRHIKVQKILDNDNMENIIW